MSHTPSALGWVNYTVDRPNVCRWNEQPAAIYEDGRNIPTFSAPQNPQALIKPDLVAPATRVTGPVSAFPPCASNNTFCNSALATLDGITYGFSAGTSFAAPAVAGAGAIVRRWYANVGGSKASPAITKAMLINGALDLGPRAGNPPIPGAILLQPDPSIPAPQPAPLVPAGSSLGNIPDPYQGWGMLSLTRLLGPASDYFFYDERASLASGYGVWQKHLTIRDGARETRATLVWTDSPSSIGIENYKVVNDLNLSVARSSGSHTWYGNRLTGGFSIANPVPLKLDKANNVEQVILPMNTFASGESVVLAVDPFNVPASGQSFAIFVDNATEPGTTLQMVSPCRAINTYDPPGPYGGPAIPANASRTFALAGRCGIPSTVRAIALNITVVDPPSGGVLKAYQSGILPPSAGALYYNAWQTRGNNGLILFAPGGNLVIRCEQGTGATNVIVDVTGYYQ